MSAVTMFIPIPAPSTSSRPSTLPQKPGSRPTQTPIPPFQLPHLFYSYSHLEDRRIEHDEWCTQGGYNPDSGYKSVTSPDNIGNKEGKISDSITEKNPNDSQPKQPPPPTSLPQYTGPAPLHSPLSHGFHTHISRSSTADATEHLDGVLLSLLSHHKKTGRKPGENGWGIVTWRGVLTKLLTLGSGLEERDGWEMNVMGIGGVVYMELYTSREERERRESEEGRFKEQAYHGYAFESFSTRSFPTSDSTPPKQPPSNKPSTSSLDPPNWSVQVNTNVQWCAVVKSRIGGGSAGKGKGVELFYGGEVDCMEGDWTGKPLLSKCIELKTNMVISSPGQRATFEKKLLKHWAQSYLLGIRTIEIGFRDREGILKSVERFKTLEIPQMVQTSTSRLPPWSAHSCLQTFSYLCEEIASVVLKDDPFPKEADKTDDDDGEEGWSPSRPNGTPPLPKPSTPRDISTILSSPPPIFRITFTPSRERHGITIRRLVGQELDEMEVMSEAEQKNRWGFLLREYVVEMM